MNSRALAAAAMLSLGAGACSAPNSAPTGATTSSTSATNPYGANYPTEGLGVAARAGDTPGAVIANYRFDGYLPTGPGIPIEPGALRPIALADYFDPELRHRSSTGKPYRLLHIQVSFLWCTPCNEEARAIVRVAKAMEERGILFLTAVADGPIRGKPATVVDLDAWILKHKGNYAHVLDPAVRSFGNFFDPNTGSFNADIDLRTMEILQAGSGQLPDVQAHVEKWLAWTESHPSRPAGP